MFNTIFYLHIFNGELTAFYLHVIQKRSSSRTKDVDHLNTQQQLTFVPVFDTGGLVSKRECGHTGSPEHLKRTTLTWWTQAVIVLYYTENTSIFATLLFVKMIAFTIAPDHSDIYVKITCSNDNTGQQ